VAAHVASGSSRILRFSVDLFLLDRPCILHLLQASSASSLDLGHELVYAIVGRIVERRPVRSLLLGVLSRRTLCASDLANQIQIGRLLEPRRRISLHVATLTACDLDVLLAGDSWACVPVEVLLLAGFPDALRHGPEAILLVPFTRCSLSLGDHLLEIRAHLRI